MTKFLFLYKLFFFAEIKVSVFCLICFIFWAHPSENVSLFTEASSTIDNQSICPSCFLPEPSVLLLELKHLFSACFSGGYAQLCFSGCFCHFIILIIERSLSWPIMVALECLFSMLRLKESYLKILCQMATTPTLPTPKLI